MGNTVICNKTVNKASLRTTTLLNINQKESLGFQGWADNVASVAIGPMSVDPREIFKVISYYLKQPWGPGLRPCSKKNKLFQPRSNMETENRSVGVGDVMHTTARRIL